MGYSLPMDIGMSPATGALVSLWQECAGRVDSEYTQKTIGNQGRIWHWVAIKGMAEICI